MPAFTKTVPFEPAAAMPAAMVFFAVAKFDFGPMKRHELAVRAGEPDLGALGAVAESLPQNARGRVIDLVVPVLFLGDADLFGLIHDCSGNIRKNLF